MREFLGNMAKPLRGAPQSLANQRPFLLVGNSLLLYGVDLDRLHELTSGRMQIYPIFLEATGYYDWLYGLRRLFRQGSRPQVVVVASQ